MDHMLMVLKYFFDKDRWCNIYFLFKNIFSSLKNMDSKMDSLLNFKMDFKMITKKGCLVNFKVDSKMDSLMNFKMDSKTDSFLNFKMDSKMDFLIKKFNSNFRIPISLQPDGLKLWCFYLRLLINSLINL